MSALYKLYVDGKQINVTDTSMSGTLQEVITKLEMMDEYINVVLWKEEKTDENKT